MKEYIRLIRKLPIYHQLLAKIIKGQNILITEVDVPHKDKKVFIIKTWIIIIFII